MSQLRELVKGVYMKRIALQKLLTYFCCQMSDTLLEIRQKSQDVKGRGSNTVHEDFDVKNDNRHPSHFFCKPYLDLLQKHHF